MQGGNTRVVRKKDLHTERTRLTAPATPGCLNDPVTANASHELRTPLALQRILVQVALTDPEADSESLRAACEKVLASGTHQERIIEALLILSRGQAGLDKRESFGLATLASQVLQARQSDAQDRQIAIRSALAPASAPATRGRPSA